MSAPLPVPVARAQRAAIHAGQGGDAIFQLVLGPTLALYAGDVLGLDAAQIGLLALIAPLAALLRLPLLGVVDRVGWVRTLAFTARLRLVVVAALALTPTAWMSPWLLAAGVALFTAAREAGLGTVWQPLLAHQADPATRTAFLARLRTRTLTFSVVTQLLAALVVGAAMTDDRWRLLLCGALALLALHARNVDLLVEPPPRPRRHLGWRTLWGVARRTPLLRRQFVVQLLWLLAGIPLAVVWLRQGVGTGAGSALLFTAAGAVGLIATAPWWARRAAAHGADRVLRETAWLHVLGVVPLLFLPPGGAWPPLVAAGALLGAASAASVVFVAAQHEAAHRDPLAELAVAGLAWQGCAALWAVAAGWLLAHVAIPLGAWSWGVLHLDAVRAWALVAGLVVIAGGWWRLGPAARRLAAG